METRITKLLGIKYPVIQGGMAWVATHELASAVSNAGGLGIIGAGGAPASWVTGVYAAEAVSDATAAICCTLLFICKFPKILGKIKQKEERAAQ